MATSDAAAAALELGCKVTYGIGKTGVVRFVGETDFAAGEWVGLELARPDGKNNGEVNGRVYFSCGDNRGLFIKRSQVRGVISRPSASGGSTPTRRLSGVGAGDSRRLSGVGAAGQTSERRLSGVGAGASRLRPPSAGSAPSSAIPRASTPPSSRTGSGNLPLASVAASASATTPAPTSRSVLRSSIAVPSSSSGSSSSTTPVRRVSSIASTSSRFSLDTARRTSINRTPSIAADDQLVEAQVRIAKLEEELEQKNRHVEQLKQSVSVMKETVQAAAVAARKESIDQQQGEGAEQVVDQVMEAVDETESMEVDGQGDNEDGGVTESPEALLAKQVEAVRQEAEEHVRAVRSELEDHISQLQSEHEELLDELRLENATQASEIKTLEAEIAQQKARIVQFTAAEQKKAEEVAFAVARSSKGERKVEALEAQISEFQDMVEMMTLEKETLEMDKEIAEERVEELQQEVEKLRAAMALAAAAPERVDDDTGASSSDIAEENKKLRAAVKALHERGSEEKAELSKKVRQLQRENTELVNLREEVEQLVRATPLFRRSRRYSVYTAYMRSLLSMSLDSQLRGPSSSWRWKSSRRCSMLPMRMRAWWRI